jgi:hypothetical protein
MIFYVINQELVYKSIMNVLSFKFQFYLFNLYYYIFILDLILFFLLTLIDISIKSYYMPKY